MECLTLAPLYLYCTDGCARVLELNGTQEMKETVYTRLIRYTTVTPPPMLCITPQNLL